MTITYHGPTIEACMKEVKHAGFDEASDLMTALRSLPVAEWTREPNADGFYIVTEAGYPPHRHLRRKYVARIEGTVGGTFGPWVELAGEEGSHFVSDLDDPLFLHLDPLLPPPPAVPTREGD